MATKSTKSRKKKKCSSKGRFVCMEREEQRGKAVASLAGFEVAVRQIARRTPARSASEGRSSEIGDSLAGASG
jgi:hypothetical protein